MDHISSFKPRQSHYSIRDNPQKLYLPETLTIKDMHKMFLGSYKINAPYKVYWRIFKEKFNISFGWPRSDTCTQCDTLNQQINTTTNNDDKVNFIDKRQLHLSKAESFYRLKRLYKQRAQMNLATVLSFDFMQNLPISHLESNILYYSRQLWLYIFGVHNLADDRVTLLTYHEGVAKKGQCEVTSMLFRYLKEENDLNRN
ncbi:hypothetical protein ANN_19457 [Periplaneta americana]|uniref:Uncharacterized protein n=1 Tax=Periplaneta americana TaxID=6978 RepID=A0ABQ8SB24_PERAM|nr:hypothetical protein ANN_19457 [Periplaneta americana]